MFQLMLIHRPNLYRYDATGLGESKDVPLQDARFSHWIEDARTILSEVVEGPQIVIGSSMGAWITSLLAPDFKDIIKAALFIGPAVNFSARLIEDYKKRLPQFFTDRLESGEILTFEHPDYGNVTISKALFDNFFLHNLPLEKGIDLQCPMHIFHGMKDKDVPFRESIDLIQAFKSTDASLTYIKNGQHQLNKPHDLKVLCNAFLDLADKVEGNL